MLVIYLKLQLSTLSKDGVFDFKGIEDDIATELALDLGERETDVRAALDYLLENGLCERLDETHYSLPWVAANTGSETASTQRVRDYRERKALHCNEDVTAMKRDGNVEKEIEKIRDRDRYTRTRKNKALQYAQTPINAEDFNALVVDLNKEPPQLRPKKNGKNVGYANRLITMEQVNVTDLNEDLGGQNEPV